jgi:osmoprotectant transport system permease protein
LPVADFPAHVAQHLVLAVSALALALSAGLPLGVVAAESSALRSAVLALAGIGRTIPSLAVLMLLLPWLGVGSAPAIVALALLAVPPIVISVDLGIRGVPIAALDAAAGMGMTPVQRFARVVVPFALPVSFTGLRTAATETIASATLATFIGAGGLGDEIVRGLQTDDPSLLFAAAAAVAALALGADLALSAAGRLVAARA